MPENPPGSLIDKKEYNELLGTCLENVEEDLTALEQLEQEGGDSLQAKEDVQQGERIHSQPWFIALSAASALSLLVFAATYLSTEQVADFERAREQRQITFGADFHTSEAIVDFLMSGEHYAGPNDPAFRRALDRLNSALTSSHGEDFQPFLSEDFNFRGPTLIYSRD